MDTYEVKSKLFGECRKIVEYSMFWEWYFEQQEISGVLPLSKAFDMQMNLYASKCGSYIARSIVESAHGK